MDHTEPDPSVLQNLTDAGCDGETVNRYCKLEQQSLPKQTVCKEQILLLQKHRKEVVSDLHGCQDRLECLDYLLYQLREQQKQANESEERND